MNNLKKFWVGGALNMAAGAYGAISGAVQERNARRRMAMAAEEAASPIRSQAARQRVARQEGDAQAAIDSALRAEATAAQQLAQAGGARALAGRTAGLQRATGMSTDRALQRFGDYGAQVSAAQDAAQVNQINQRLGGNLDRLARAADAGRAQMLGGIAQGIGGIAQVAGSLSKKKGDNIEVETADSITGLQTKGPANLTEDIGSVGGIPQPGADLQTKGLSTFSSQSNIPSVKRRRGLPSSSFENAAKMASGLQSRRAPEVNFESLRDEPFVPQIQDGIPLEDLSILGKNITLLPEMDPIDTSFPRNTSNSENLILNPDGGYNLYDDGSKDYKYNLSVGPLPGTTRSMSADAQGFRIPGGVRRSPYFASKRSQDVQDMMIPFDEAIEEEFMYDRGGMQPKSSEEEVDALKAMMRMVSHIKKEVGPHSLEEEVEETPGEFNHDTNPIDIVQDDEKIGEMTGGEYIFNPEQAEMLKQLSEEGDSELHDFVRNLLSKEQFNG